MGHGVLPPWRAVGSPLPEDVTDSGAGDDEQLTPTHPDLSERHRHTVSTRERERFSDQLNVSSLSSEAGTTFWVFINNTLTTEAEPDELFMSLC